MKKLKIILFVSGALTLLQLLPYLFAGWPLLRLVFTSDASAIGIIGGADGPTSIIVAKKLPGVLAFLQRLFFPACAATFLVSLALLIKKSKSK